MFHEASQRISRYSPLKIGTWAAIIVSALIGCFYFFFYSPYLQGLSSSEEKLYGTLRTTGDMQSLQGIEAETTVKLFLYSIEKEDWAVSSLFYDTNGEGTMNTAFGPVKATPDVLKRYRRNFIGEKDSLVQEGGKDSNVGYIVLQDPMTVAMYRNGGVWYIHAFNEQ